MLQRLHRLLGAAEHLLALIVEQTVGVAHQRRRLLQHRTGLLADRRQLLHCLTDVAALIGDGAGGLFQVFEGLADALDVLRGKHLIGVVHQDVHASHQIVAVVEQPGDR